MCLKPFWWRIRESRRVRQKQAIAGSLLLLAAGAAAAAGWGADQFQFEENKPWVELQRQLPPYPKAENEVEFYVGPATPHHFFLDKHSINIGADGVVRYTLIVKAAGGAENVSFEGIRCTSKEMKIYAIGGMNGQWVEPLHSEWRNVSYQDINRQHNRLYSDILCPDRLPARHVDDILQRMKE